MSRLLLVARHEYLRHMRRRGFLLATLGLPLLVLAGMGLIILLAINSARPEAAIGYVDQPGLLAGGDLPLPVPDGEPSVPLRAFPDEAAARAALDAGQIDAYAVIPPDYLATGALTVYGGETLSPTGRRSLQAALDAGLLAQADLPATAEARARDPLGELELRTPDGALVDPTALIGRVAVAILGSLLFMVTVFSSASYLLQAMVEEKENRTMEIIATTITSGQLIGGKIFGLGLLGMTIAAVWLTAVAAAWAIGATFFAPLRTVSLSLAILAPAALLLPLGFLLFAGIMVAISAMVTTAQEGQQFAGVFTLLAVVPLIVSGVFFTNPDGPIATGLSLFPLSAPVAMLLRLVQGTVPAWQLALSMALLAAAAALAIWGASKIFRVGMLRYGQRLSLREALRALRAN
jgi:ABC-2 type transport system permease protein